MNHSITSMSDGAANDENDETLVEAHPTQYKGLEEPQSSAWLSLVILGTFLAMAYLFYSIRRKLGIG